MIPKKASVQTRDQASTAPWVRVAIMLVATVVAFVLAWFITGSLVPSKPTETIIFQQGLLLIVLGSSIIEDKFTKPADSVVNSLMGMITLIPVYQVSSPVAWWVVFGYCLVVFIMAVACTFVSGDSVNSGWRAKVSSISYRPAVRLGAARILFSILFLFAVFSFLGIQSIESAVLVVFWGVFVVIWPLRIPEIFSSFRIRSTPPTPSGKILRNESPNLIRIDISPEVSWEQPGVFVWVKPGGVGTWVLPLYSQPYDDSMVATGLCSSGPNHLSKRLMPGYVYPLEEATAEKPPSAAEIAGGRPQSQLVGFIVEDSEISEIRFEALGHGLCRAGMLVWCRVGEEKVYFQITNGVNREESLETQRHGFQVAHAVQLGVPASNIGFQRYDWLPPMNTPVFSEVGDFGQEIEITEKGDFIFGQIPNSKISVGGPLAEVLDHHMAILGVTGSGKTEMAFDVVRHALDQGKKVICIDLTAQYEERLANRSPVNLSLNDELSDELGKKLFEAETGEYGGGKEKQLLKKFAERLRTNVQMSVKQFIEAEGDKSNLGVIKLEEISNTKATLFITEMFMTCLLHYARDNVGPCPGILVVVEEAHTVMPETSTMGLGDYDSRGLVSKIAQIALQGRKYGVGLLVIAQRTATVSKTVLTQCNTIVSFNCFDDTSLKFLGNIFGKAHIDLIPNLKKLQAVVFGRGVRSERPVVVEIPYDPLKERDVRGNHALNQVSGGE